MFQLLHTINWTQRERGDFYPVKCRLLHDVTDGECLTCLEDIQTTVIFTHIRTKEESWNFNTLRTGETDLRF